MKKGLMFCLCSLMLSGACLTAAAQDVIYSVVQTRGNGCPEGTASVVTSPDGKTVSILFDAFQSTVPSQGGDNDNASMGRGRSDQNINYKVCDVVLEATLEQGHRLTGVNLTAQLRGNVEADLGTSASIISTLMEYRGPFQVGRGGAQTIARKDWLASRGPVSEDFQIDQARSLDMHGGGCAAQQDKKFRMVMKNVVNTRILPGYEAQSPMAMLSLDTADVSSGFTVALQTAPCGPRGPHGPGGPGRPGGPGGNPGRGNGGGRGGAPSVRCPFGPGSCR